MNNRRQFIKRSFFAGLLGIFAPSLIKTRDIEKYSYIQDGPFFHSFMELHYYSFYGKDNSFLTFEVSDPQNILFYDKNQRGVYKWRKVKNFYCKHYNNGYKKDNEVKFELA